VPWHAIVTRPRAELEATRMLQERLGLRTFLPQHWVWISHARRREQLPRPLFPRYIFAHASIRDNIYAAKSLPNVIDVVRTSNRPLTIPDQVMAELIARADPDGLMRGTKAAVAEPAYRVGEYRHLARNGPLHDLICQIASVDSGGSLHVWLEAFGSVRQVRVHRTSLGEVAASPNTAKPIADRARK
jgi:transcription antitermination factor NusG